MCAQCFTRSFLGVCSITRKKMMTIHHRRVQPMNVRYLTSQHVSIKEANTNPPTACGIYYRLLTKVEVGDGRTMAFWHDCWMHTPLSSPTPAEARRLSAAS
jgi:hypothetical protein